MNDLLDESRYIYHTNPDAFALFTEKEATVRELISILDQVKQRQEFTGIILYGTSSDKEILAEAMAAYLGGTYYDLVTEDEDEEEELPPEVSQAFSHRFIQLLAEDIENHHRAIVCWADREDDFHHQMEPWEKELEDGFEAKILHRSNVVAINIIEAPELMVTDAYQPEAFEFKVRVDD